MLGEAKAYTLKLSSEEEKTCRILDKDEAKVGETFRPLRGFFSLRFEVQVWGLDYCRKRIGLIGVWEKTEGAKVSQVNMY